MFLLSVSTSHEECGLLRTRGLEVTPTNSSFYGRQTFRQGLAERNRGRGGRALSQIIVPPPDSKHARLLAPALLHLITWLPR